MIKNLGTFGVLTAIGLVVLVGGCPVVPDDSCLGVVCDDGKFCNGVETCVDGACVAGSASCEEGETCDEDSDQCVAGSDGLDEANAVRGGSLYDKWWVVVGADAPTDDFARWAMRPDTESNSRTGADTWRCKECHGWDYKGVDGAYGSGSHRTGFGGIFGTTKSAQELFDTIDGHGFGDSGLVEGDIWDLAKFVLEGLIDTDDIIDADNAFTGDVDAGQVLYDDGIGTNMACAVCHGADGMTIEFHDDEFLGELAVDNPWEFQHKVRFGNPGTAMPAAVDVGATNDDVAAVGAYSQTLATGP